MTSCGCFEVICAYVPECNGIIAVNREYMGETPVGMTFSSLAGNVGGGVQTPGFIGCGKVYLTSKKFIFAEGGHKRLVWMPSALKQQLADDLKKRFEEQGASGLLDKIADETTVTTAEELRGFLEKSAHPVLAMEDMGAFAQSASENRDIPDQKPLVEKPDNAAQGASDKDSHEKPAGPMPTADLVSRIKEEVIREIIASLSQSPHNAQTDALVAALSGKYLGADSPQKNTADAKANISRASKSASARAKIAGIKSFPIRREKCEAPVRTVKLGATKAEGGSRGKTHTIGGATCMPFHFWEGDMPHKPLLAMEVFDTINEKFPEELKKAYGDLIHHPAEMAKLCVDKYGADLISVRLEGAHPEKGNLSVEQSVRLVKDVLKSVDVPLIITGHNHFEKNNEVMKAVAQECANENLLLNWVEQDNYRTIAGAALAYGHSLVAQSPIDVNIGKQLNILLSNMDMKPDRIVMDAMTGAAGYGIEYTYSVMERIRMTGLGGDVMLTAPMIVTPGQECAKVKEVKATEAQFPQWGDRAKRAALWELTTATALLYAGADVLIMYHPEAAMEIKKTISRLMEG